jgi:hypothetical protein
MDPVVVYVPRMLFLHLNCYNPEREITASEQRVLSGHVSLFANSDNRLRRRVKYLFIHYLKYLFVEKCVNCVFTGQRTI